MTAKNTVIPEWLLLRTADEIRDRAKRSMVIGGTIIGFGAVGSIVTYSSAVRDFALPVAIIVVLVGGIMLMRGTRRWSTAYDRAERALTSPSA